MRSTRYLGAAVCASLLFAATACGDDDDETTAQETTTTVAEGPTAIEVTITADGLEGMPSELPAGLVEITLVNEAGGYSSLDISRVEAGTTEDEFVEGMAPVFEGGEFPAFFESNVGVEAEDGTTATSLVVLDEGEHIVWFEPPEGDDEEPETETETATETETETATETEPATDGDEPTTTVAEEPTTTASTTTTTAATDEGAAGSGEPVGTLTAVAAEDEPEVEEPLAEEPEEEQEEGGEEPSSVAIQTQALTVTAGADAAELPEADGEIVATDYEFDVTFDGAGTINFRNDGPQQFHHAVVMDFGTNDPAAVEEAFPAILASEGEGTPEPDTGDVDLSEVDFEFAGSGVFGPDGAAGTFEADITEGNTYVVVCFIQDRTGGPPPAVAYDMWVVVQAGGGGDTTTTTDG